MTEQRIVQLPLKADQLLFLNHAFAMATAMYAGNKELTLHTLAMVRAQMEEDGQPELMAELHETMVKLLRVAMPELPMLEVRIREKP